MLEYVKGNLVATSPTQAVVDINGLAYELLISLFTYEKIKGESSVKLLAHLHIKEDAHTLYGFFTEQERKLFRHLITVSGIGAGTARLMLSSLPPDEIENAILSGNVALLQNIKGIGAKTAQRVLIDLRDKLAKSPTGSGTMLQSGGSSSVRSEAAAALQMLGFARPAIDKAIDKILAGADANVSVENVIKNALKIL